MRQEGREQSSQLPGGVSRVCSLQTEGGVLESRYTLPSTCLGLQRGWGVEADTRMKPWLKPGGGLVTFPLKCL